MRTHLLPVLVVAMSGCIIGDAKYQRPRDLEESWMVDRTRLLAVQADPPEIRPGETARFSALMPQPDQETPWPRVWFACPVDGGAGFGCNLDLAGTGSGTGATGGFDDGFIGIEPGLPPAYTAPADFLDGISDDAERAEGLQVLAQVAALPPKLLEDPNADIDFNEVELGFKRLVVSEASTPNQNPAIYEFVVDRLPIPVDSLVHLTPHQTYELGVVLEESLVEDYEYLNPDGDIEMRREEPYATWYATGGEVLEPITLYPYTESSWTAPKSGDSGTWFAVVRDRRGGIAWHTQDWVVD